MLDSFIMADSNGRDTSNLKVFDITVIRIADYINKVVGTRKIPDNKKGTVVMKLDVEVEKVSYLSPYFKSYRAEKLLFWQI